MPADRGPSVALWVLGRVPKTERRIKEKGRDHVVDRTRVAPPACALALLSVGSLFVVGPAQAADPGRPVAWGCGGIGAWGQCNVPSGLSGVTAIAAGQDYGLALKSDGRPLDSIGLTRENPGVGRPRSRSGATAAERP